MATPQWKQISDTIRSRIEAGELAPGDRLDSEEKIAIDWGVSRQTAHRSIHELDRMGFVTRKRRWGTVVASKSSKTTGRVGLIVDQFAKAVNFPSGDFLNGLQDGLGEEIGLVCCESKRDPEREIRNLRKLEAETDAIAIYPTTNPKTTPIIQRIFDSGKPIVVLDRIPPALEVDSVVTDNELSTLRAMRALIERGHRRIGFFSFHKPGFSSVAERYAGYLAALEGIGVTDRDLVRWFPPELEAIPEAFVQTLYDAAFTMLKRENPITALFCVQDSIAAASLEAAERIGVTIPTELELATFNDWPPMMLRRPWQAHRLVQNQYEIGHKAAEVLRLRLDGSVEPPTIWRVPAEFFPSDAGLVNGGWTVATILSSTNGGY